MNFLCPHFLLKVPADKRSLNDELATALHSVNRLNLGHKKSCPKGRNEKKFRVEKAREAALHKSLRSRKE